ncbi:TetR/AcrR family transcriptional regulator [Sphingomonas sp. 7/4-4]|uniref:TetR/AcrR family transcriptional regulator n=1 Tax=Sphingomonas sp. 7/4-4 TaxID=3018446 RepID=UPI0022F3FB84|nr:TetR/AcrR family transcriptional regulator [Sphingomonas sp. 7/4-4]WBY06558.1 TetR/AcrR family transcriptional regulator [Sphingomonas sp. 7/4-4]
MRLFWRKTYEGTSLADLTEVMGINPPSLYAAFGSKEELFREAVALYAEHQGVEIWRALEEAPTAREAVESFLLVTAHAYSEPDDPPGCLIVLGAQHGLDEDNAARRELRTRRRNNLTQIADRFARAVLEGELPPAFPVEDAAAFYLSVQSGMSVLARDGADRATLEAVARGRCSVGIAGASTERLTETSQRSTNVCRKAVRRAGVS